MPIYLVHPQHGTHIVYFEHDAVECEKNGWARRVEVAPVVIAPPAVIPEPEAAPAKRKYVRKPKP